MKGKENDGDFFRNIKECIIRRHFSVIIHMYIRYEA